MIVFFRFSRQRLNAAISLSNVAIAVVAGTVTCLAARKQNTFFYGHVLVEKIHWIPADRWALGSNYPELAAIYYLFISPIIFSSFATTIVYLCFPFRGRLALSYTWKQRIIAVFGFFLFAALALFFIISAKGEDTRLLKVGTSFYQLVILGWAPFATCGVLAALGCIMLFKALS